MKQDEGCLLALSGAFSTVEVDAVGLQDIH